MVTIATIYAVGILASWVLIEIDEAAEMPDWFDIDYPNNEDKINH